MQAIHVANLNFDYPGKRVLHDMSFSIAPGSVTALVGPNGAGKTTLLRCIAALDRPHSGSIRLGDIDVADDPRAAHRLTGYLSDFFGLYGELTVAQTLTYIAWCHGIPGADVSARVEEVAGLVQIEDKLLVRAGVLSRGYRQRLGIGIALMHDPAVVLLDEPASGMDPEARIRLSQLVRNLKALGKTIVVSSHILNELEDYCTEMLVMKDGRMAEHVVLRDYAARVEYLVDITIDGLSDAHLAQMAEVPGLAVAAREGDMVTCRFSGDAAARQALLRDLVMRGLPVSSLSPREHRLQDAYMNITGMNAKA